LDVLVRFEPRDAADKAAREKRQIIDETPTLLAKKLTLKLRFWVGVWDWARAGGRRPVI